MVISIGRKRNVYLDTLKGISIIAVFFYHIGILPYGYLGVDIFLVINGYLITKGLNNNFENNSFSYFQFILDKLVRLWPLVLLAGLVSLTIGLVFMLPDDLENLAQSVIASNFFSNNILSCITTKNYWDVGNAYKPLMHTWYLGILMQCYVVYPLFLIASNKLKISRFWILLILTIISLVLYFMPEFSSAQKFYYLPFRFFELGLGGLTTFLLVSKRTNVIKYNTVCLTAITISMILIMFVDCEIIPKSIKLLIISILSILGVLLSAKKTQSNLQKNFALYNWLYIIGKASYSIFIWHQIVIAFYKYIYNASLDTLDVFIITLITCVISYLSYIYIESKIDKTYAKNKVFIVFILTILLLTISISFYLYKQAGVIRDVPELSISKDKIHRGMHAEYCDRIYAMDRDYAENGKIKVMVIGNSFARDMANVLLESTYADSLDITYCFKYKESYYSRLKDAKYVFVLASIEQTDFLKDISNSTKVYGISTKEYGESNGNVYSRRFSPLYFKQRVEVRKAILDQYGREKQKYGENYIDFLAPVLDENQTVSVFTDNNKYISQDCRHLTQDGAIFYSKIFDIPSLFNNHN